MFYIGFPTVFKDANMLCKLPLAIFVHLIGSLLLISSTYVQYAPGLYPQDYVQAHNDARAEVGVSNLTWNTYLEAYAVENLNQRANDCSVATLVHSRGSYGLNFFLFGDGYIQGTTAVADWVSEKDYYDYDSNSCAAGQVCGNYTQLIWQETQSLGCATVRSPIGNITGCSLISCYYNPPGNILGQRPYRSTNQSAPTPQPLPPKSASLPPYISTVPFLKGRRKNLRLAISISTGGACAAIVGLIWFILRWKRKPYKNACPNELYEEETGPRKFSYSELASATKKFGEEEKLGEGGFGVVYKGFLRDLNIYVAVKKISRSSKQGRKEYATEVNIISQLRHRNMVKLIGWCHEKELMLVYDFMPNGSLDSHLFKGKSLLTWTVRYKIIQGLASALQYLHEEGDHCVLHRDIKSSNVMLDSNFNAKLGDFGLARLVDHEKGSQTTGLAGTLGYMAPECVTASKASKESDVYSFGIVALEIACGRRSIEHKYEEDEVSLVPWVWEFYGNRRLVEVVDKKLCMNFDRKQMECLVIVGLWCAHPVRDLRPSIMQVIQVLNFDSPLPNLPCKMPTPRYDVPTASAVVTSVCKQSLSLTVPR